MDEATLQANKAFIHERMSEACEHVQKYLVAGAKVTIVWRLPTVDDNAWSACSDDDLPELVAFLQRKISDNKVKRDLPPPVSN